MNDEELRRRIAERARQLWEEAGRPEGRDMEYWLEAEEELAPLSVAGHRQVDAGEDREAPSLIGAVALCGSFGTSGLGPDRERLRADGSVLGGREVIPVEMKEVVDLVVGREEPLRLAG
jgi:hypothetical protein